jgi:ArsR family transcriptional regulator, arsenate/arsenite/antimonite-responsive transcriptional repressor
MTFTAVCKNSWMRITGAARRSRADAAGARAAALLRAFSDRNRLRILHVLREGEMCVGDLVTALRIPQARVSRHLAYLRKTGLVKARKDGLWMHDSLASAQGSVHRALLSCLGGCFQELPELAADAKRCRALEKTGGCC